MNQPATKQTEVAKPISAAKESCRALTVTEATDMSYLGARIIAALLLIILSPLLILIGLSIKICSAGPVLYRQVRVGRFGREFEIVKFRTMVTDAEKHTGAVLAVPGDSRVTPLGKLLRATHLDELPQLWNVVAGHMGFIGPRPERPVFVVKFKQRIARYDERHLVHPGITGLAQILLPYDALPEEKLRYDLTYMDARLGWRLKAHIIKATAMKMVRSMIPFIVRYSRTGDYRSVLESFLKEGTWAFSKV
jgi:lipopolysaccharide/colanic/teichoic acid biosynthesis glycosyltransferase